MAYYYQMEDGSYVYTDDIDPNVPIQVQVPITSPAPDEGQLPEIPTGEPQPTMQAQTVTPDQIQHFMDNPGMYGATLKEEDMRAGSNPIDANLSFSRGHRTGIGSPSGNLMRAQRDFNRMTGRMDAPGMTAQAFGAGTAPGLTKGNMAPIDMENPALAGHLAGPLGQSAQAATAGITQGASNLVEAAATNAARIQGKKKGRLAMPVPPQGRLVGPDQMAQGIVDNGGGPGIGVGVGVGTGGNSGNVGVGGDTGAEGPGFGGDGAGGGGGSK